MEWWRGLTVIAPAHGGSGFRIVGVGVSESGSSVTGTILTPMQEPSTNCRHCESTAASHAVQF